MRSDLEVDTEALRAWAATLRRRSDRMDPDPLPPAAGPRWSSTSAGAAAAQAARRALTLLLGDLQAIGRAAEAAAGDYEDVDAGVATRMRGER
ncbi:hypothetical protein [Actinoplanes sp. NPDC051494]|uniref:hypothetical protein n=1 Tax=Actinoplanes sp. NPDC051494 TaxID=3363907 RepID=UPI0037B62F77